MKRKRIIWKILGGIVAFLFLVFVALCVLVYINRDKIAGKVKAEVNKSINGQFDFQKAGLSLRHFPALGICLEDFSIVGADPFENDTLISGQELNFSVNLWSLLKSSEAIEIKYLTLQSPQIRILVLEDGRDNYDIIKEAEMDTTAVDTAATTFNIALQSYAIEDARVIYDDRSVDVIIDLTGLDHKGSGNFTESVFDLDMESHAEEASITYASVTYLRKIILDLDNILHVDLNENRYTFKEANAMLNALALNLDGYVSVQDEVTYQFNFNAPGNEFKELFSILPYAYTEDFENMQAQGTFSLAGSFGEDTGQDFLHYQVDARVQDASFKYPDLPVGMNDIQLTAAVSNPGKNTDATLINVTRLSWLLGDEPFNANFRLTNPVSDPTFDGMARGAIDLETFGRAFPMKGVTTLAGILHIDAKGKGRMSMIENGQYEQVDLVADLRAENVRYEADGQPPLFVPEANINISPQFLTIHTFIAEYGNSDMDVTGKLKNGLLLVTGKGDVSGNVSLRSGKMDLNTFLGESETMEETQDSPVASSSQQIDPMYDALSLDIDASIDTLLYESYDFHNSSASGQVRGQQIIIDRLQTIYEGEQINASGTLENVWNYSYLGQTLEGNLVVETSTFDANPFLTSGNTAGEESAPDEPMVVPTGYAINIQAKANTLKFQNFELRNFSTGISIKEGVANLVNLRSNFLGGTMTLNGTYDTRDPQSPLVKVDYNLQSFGFQETFEAVNIFAAMAPIAEFIEGSFNSSLSLESALTPDLNPLLGTVDAKGFLQTMRGQIANFPPLEKAAGLLQFDFLKNIPIQGSISKFNIVDGTVFVEPFDIKYQDVVMTFSGQHKLDEGMDYQIQMELPFQRIKDKIGAGKALASVSEQARKFGIDLKEGVRVNLLVNLKGSIKDPQVSFRLLSDFEENLMESVKQQIDAKVDSLKNIAKEKIDTAKAVVKETIEEKKVELTQKVNQEITALKARAQATADRIRSEAQALAENVREEGYAQADNLIESAGDDPLKKIAAKNAADQLRKETDKRVNQIISKADAEAQAVIRAAESKADSLRLSIQ